MNKNRLKAIDFFCGAGGVTCGFKEAGIEVIAGIDIDSRCKETYEKNNRTEFLNMDISQVSPEVLKNRAKRNDDNLILAGCSPCQYYSQVKTDKSKAHETRNLLSFFQNFVEYYRPGFVFVENVPGFKKSGPIGKFKEFLSNNGYTFEENILNAAGFGVPQNRRRYALLASRVGEIKLPEESGETKTVWQAIGDIKTFYPVKAGNIDRSNFNHTTASLSDLNLKRILKTSHNGGDRREWHKELQLECHKNHRGHYDVYGRMHWDRPSPTITTRFNGLSNGRYGHPEQDRAISIREGATLQSFPLDYVFYSRSMVRISKMIGNAVPPEFAKAIAEEIKKAG